MKRLKYLKLYESFINKEDVLNWMYSNNILNKGEQINRNGVKKLLDYLIAKNEDLIKRTALKNCHAVGLNSFILNSEPKIRLFICDDECEVRSYDPYNPIIPIHPHKYDDLFFQINGKLTHHLYEKNTKGIKFNIYNFIRLNTIESEIVKLGEENLRYIGQFSNVNRLRSKTLHGVSVEGDCSWIIIETKKDEDFEEKFYHQNLQRRNELYKKFEDPIRFLKRFVNNL